MSRESHFKQRALKINDFFLYCLAFFSIRTIDDPFEIEAKESNDTFDDERDVKLLIHGWNADPEHVALETVRNAYLRLNTSHVLMADWREIASMRYLTAREMIASVGKAICKQLKTFAERAQIGADKIHIVGHSLGAHIATHVGRCFNRQLARYEVASQISIQLFATLICNL